MLEMKISNEKKRGKLNNS